MKMKAQRRKNILAILCMPKRKTRPEIDFSDNPISYICTLLCVHIQHAVHKKVCNVMPKLQIVNIQVAKPRTIHALSLIVDIILAKMSLNFSEFVCNNSAISNK